MGNAICFYGLLAVITAICAELSVRFKDPAIGGFFAFNAVLIPSVAAGLRYGIGTDYLAVYLPEFERFQYVAGYHSRMEFGYVLLNKLVIALGGNFQVLLFSVALTTNLFIYLGLRQYREEISVGLGMLVYMLLYYQVSYNAVRQLAAMAVLFYAIKYVQKREFWKFCFFTLLACGFHYSLFLLFPFYFLYGLYSKPKWWAMRWITYVILLAAATNYQSFYSVFKDSDMLAYYSGYLRQTKAFEWSIGIFARTLPFLIPGIILYKDFKGNDRFRLLFSFLCIGSILRLMAYTTIYYTERVAMIFLLSQIVLVPWFYRRLRARKQTWIGLIVLSCVVFLWIYDFFIMGSGETVPYVFYFNHN